MDSDLPPDWRYEATIQEIESIITEIEAGYLDLANVFERFSAAILYLRQCETFLASRQGQMELLIEELGDETEF
jgi:exodeoxyribonuclease VII small subunit